jgi:hypothetical protein
MSFNLTTRHTTQKNKVLLGYGLLLPWIKRKEKKEERHISPC